MGDESKKSSLAAEGQERLQRATELVKSALDKARAIREKLLGSRPELPIAANLKAEVDITGGFLRDVKGQAEDLIALVSDTISVLTEITDSL